MRRLLLFVNALVAAVFSAVLVMTFLLQTQIEQSARAMLVQKGKVGMFATVNQAEAVLRSTVVKSLLSADQEVAFQAEIDELRAQPEAVVNRIITRAHNARESERAEALAAKLSPKLKARMEEALEKLTGWQDAVKSRYEAALARLILDVRIFAGTNGVAATLAFLMAWAARWNGSPHLVLLSGILLLSTATIFALYVDSFFLWTFMWRSEIELWYPTSIAVLYLYLWFHFPPPEDEVRPVQTRS